MSEKKSREPYTGTPIGRDGTPSHPQDPVYNIIEIPSDCTCPFRPL